MAKSQDAKRKKSGETRKEKYPKKGLNQKPPQQTVVFL
jgi:hypothetical protein